MSRFPVRSQVAARRRAGLLAVALLAAGVALAPEAAARAAADAPPPAIDDQDLIFLSLMFRNQAKDYLAKPGAEAKVREVYDQTASWRGAPGDVVERFKKLAEAFNLMTRGSYDEGRQIATVLDLRLPAKLVEPGAQLPARLESIWERPDRFSTHYMATFQLIGPDDQPVGEPQHAHLAQTPPVGTPKEIVLAVPSTAPAGRYRVHYSLAAHHHDGSPSDPVLEADRSFYVIPDLDGRLTKLEAALAGMKEPTTESGKLALSTARWYDEIYRKGQQADVPGAYSAHPVFMIAQLQATGFSGERMEFDRELQLAETLAKRLLASGAPPSGALGGVDPLAGLEGDLRLAYTSPADGVRVPFRIFVPPGAGAGKPMPLVVALHGAGGDENAFMDRYSGLYKKEAGTRGYLAVAVNGRGPYTGYRGAAENDVLEVTDLVQKVWKVDPDRVYLMGHSMGGMGTVAIGFDHAERWAAIAPIAGYGQGEAAAAQLAKAPRLPVFIGQGDRDALVPVEGARAFQQAAKASGRDLVYEEKAGVDHLLIVDQVIKDAFDFFDAHRRGH
jgi:predicted esterase